MLSLVRLCNPIDCSPPGSSVHGDSPGKNTGGSCHALLQGIFPTQGQNPGRLHYKQILYHLSHQGSPFSRQEYWSRLPCLTLGWLVGLVSKSCQTLATPWNVACQAPRGSSQPRDWTQVSRIAGEFFTIWATRETQEYWSGVAYPFFWGVFPTQELNWDLPHCRWILYLVAELPGKPKLVQQWNKNKCVWKRWFVWLLWNQLQISFWSFERLAGKKVSSIFIYLSFLKFFFFFLIWTVFWVFIQLVTILLLLFMFCFFWPWGT